MSRLRIAFINAAHDGTDTRRNFRRELDADLVEFDATGGELPETLDFDGVVVSGSRSSVYWDEEWIAPTKEWVGEAIDAGLPCLGVCWGHQLLADVLGGEVTDMSEYEIGYREVEHTGDSPLFEGIDRRFTVFTTHSDAVTDLPPGAEEIAANDYGNHGFRKDHVFGVQFHPEYDAETAESVTKGKELADERMDAVLAGITEDNYRAACEAKLVFENFCEYVREMREVESERAGLGIEIVYLDTILLSFGNIDIYLQIQEISQTGVRFGRRYNSSHNRLHLTVDHTLHRTYSSVDSSGASYCLSNGRPHRNRPAPQLPCTAPHRNSPAPPRAPSLPACGRARPRPYRVRPSASAAHPVVWSKSASGSL